MRFNPHPNEHANEVYFSNKSKPYNFLRTLTTILFSYVNLTGVDKLCTRVRHIHILLDNVQTILFRQTSTYTRVGKRKYANIGK